MRTMFKISKIYLVNVNKTFSYEYIVHNIVTLIFDIDVYSLRVIVNTLVLLVGVGCSANNNDAS